MLLSVLHFGNLGLFVMPTLKITVDSEISKFIKTLLIFPDCQERLEDLHIGSLRVLAVLGAFTCTISFFPHNNHNKCKQYDCFLE